MGKYRKILLGEMKDMEKIAILLIALMVISVGFLSGCTQQSTDSSNQYSWETEPLFRVVDSYDEDGFEGIDYVLYVWAKVRNSGASGSKYVGCRISQDGNEYKRIEKLYLESGGSEYIRFKFNEVSYWGSGGRYSVWIE